MQTEEAPDAPSLATEASDVPSRSAETRDDEVEAGEARAEATDGATVDGGSTEDQVLEALKNVFDPELGINIVDLGLVYEVQAEDGKVHIEYTLTTMGCPIGPLIEQQMNQFVAALPGVEEFSAEMVLRPPWSPEMMSDEAKAALGVF
ncbi:MAG: metal-sulfur cluster assembly factor [Actinomycetota bacterium]